MELKTNVSTPVSSAHHMNIRWHELVSDKNCPVQDAALQDKCALVGRVGIMMLSCGTGAWRVRDSMDRVSRVMNITCSADIGLTTIEVSCFDGEQTIDHTLSLPTAGVNTDKLASMEQYVRDFESSASTLTVGEAHSMLDTIGKKPGNYKAVDAGLAAGLACGSFVFLLGGGVWEMLCAFFGAFLGNFVRRLLLDRHVTLVASIMCGVAAACLTYIGILRLFMIWFPSAGGHEAGYIGAMLFVIPGFPLITSGIDMAKVDMRSGLERLCHALMIIVVATLTGWLVAMVVSLQPDEFQPQGLGIASKLMLRMVFSFFGVYGFSIMFNSPRKMAAVAGCIGAVSNTLRLELADEALAAIPPEAAAFLGALCSGLLAHLVNKKLGYPRISLTVPSIVIMVPGLYMYKAMYYLGIFETGTASVWFAKAAMIVLFLPLGLIVARILTDRKFRHCN